MALSPGERLGPYEVQSAIGAGGMGEVYAAIDTNLGRRVAIKVLPEAFSQDRERLARFEREAKTLAALNHPHIAQIYGLEKSSGMQALVMELVEGDDLSQRIGRGPIPLDEALWTARQIADALEAAHEQGIIHRDLKPANIKVRSDGTVKVLDFGLAKLNDANVPNASKDQHALSMSPTITSPAMMTGVGMLLGTAAYMAPEQARGKAVDKRADIWAFGCVLFEMLTGERLFKGDDLTETLASVIKEQPDIGKAPPQVHRLLKRCLEKDPGKRLRDIGDAWDLLTEPTAIASARNHAQWLPWGVAAALGIAAAGIASVHFRATSTASPPLVRFQIPVVDEAGVPNPAIAPDGKRIVYQAGNRLSMRDMDSLSVRQLPGTDGTINQPFWSSDSKFVVFGAAGSLKKIDVSGGPPQTLCALPGVLGGGFWTSDGRIVFAVAGRLFEVPAGGGTASALNITGGAGAVSLRSGAGILPDGQRFVYTVGAGPDESRGIYATSLKGDGVPKKLLPDQSDVSYVPSHNGSAGHLLFVRAGTLMAQQFDPASLDLSGEAVSLDEQVQKFSASESGSLAYRTGAATRRLTWYDRRGTATGTAWAPGPYNELALSPDDSRVAVVRANPPTTWIHEFAREASVRVAFKGTAVKPVWLPDGSQIVVVSSQGNGQYGIVQNVAGGAGHEETLLTSVVPTYPWNVSRDGRWLLYSQVDARTKEDLWLLPMQGDRKPEPFLATDYAEIDGVFSPDGRFIAYVSDESGRFEVYVRSFPATAGGKWVVSNGGGYQPRWRRDGRELFYFSNDGRLMSVDVAAAATFQASAPHFLFQVPIFGGGASTSNHYWDVTADGQRFLINTVSAESGSSGLTVVLNWQEALKRAAPAL